MRLPAKSVPTHFDILTANCILLYTLSIGVRQLEIVQERLQCVGPFCYAGFLSVIARPPLRARSKLPRQQSPWGCYPHAGAAGTAMLCYCMTACKPKVECA